MKIIKKTEKFTIYKPENKKINILYLRDEKGNDWYEYQKIFGDRTIKLQIDVNSKIVAQHTDVSTFFPVDCYLAEVTELTFSAVNMYLIENKLVKYRDIDEATEKAIAFLDYQAGVTRRRLLPMGDLVEQEYLLTLEDAKNFLSNEKHLAATPVSIKAHAEIHATTYENAAKLIMDTTTIWFKQLQKIRDIRLLGKAAVKKAVEAKDIDLMIVVQPFIDELNKIKANA